MPSLFDRKGGAHRLRRFGDVDCARHIGIFPSRGERSLLALGRRQNRVQEIDARKGERGSDNPAVQTASAKNAAARDERAYVP